MSIHTPKNHQHCTVCCLPFFNHNTVIHFTLMPDGGVQSKIVPTEKVQGYQGVMQGGVITTLHDTAMTHCLFSRHVYAMTAQLDVRFIKPIPLNTAIQVQAHCLKSKRGVHFLQSSIYVNGQCYSKAEAKFMSRQGMLGGNDTTESLGDHISAVPFIRSF
ncbi:PaaI family thioesterase [Vibrio cionasavignyae]